MAEQSLNMSSSKMKEIQLKDSKDELDFWKKVLDKEAYGKK
jgi:hypothetical protein